MTSGFVARLLALSRERVVQLDDELRPRRTETGTRLYDPERVDYVAGLRMVTR